MKLELLGEHTLDVSLLTRNGWVLDAGCRDFTFACSAVERGCRVLAIDADPTVEDQSIHNVFYHHAAVAATSGERLLVMTADPQARHLDGLYEGGIRRDIDHQLVRAYTIEQLMKCFSIEHWDAVKLDVEGAEYEILRQWPGPIAAQISVEFHEHCAPRPQSLYDEIFARLGKWYDVVQHEKTTRHCTVPNFWDSLFVLREEHR